MKKIELAAIPPATANDAEPVASKSQPSTKPTVAKPPKAKKSSAANAGRVNRSISFTPEDDAYINALAFTLGADRGKALSGSEVVRHVLAAFRANEAGQGGKP